MRRVIAATCFGALVLAQAAASSSRPTVVARIATGGAPCGAATAFGAVWVASYETGSLLRLDPRRNRVSRRIRLTRGICPVAAGAGSIWVGNDQRDILYRVDPKRGRVVARIRIAHWPAHVLAEGGSVWVTGYERGTVSRIDPRTNRSAHVYQVGGNPSGLARYGDALWISFGRDGSSIGCLELATGDLTRIPIGHRAAGFLTVIGGSVWTTTGDGYAVRVDPTTRRVAAAVPVPGTPAGIAAAPDGTIWVAEKERNTITRIDPATNRVLDVSAAGRGALSIVVAAGDLWVTNFAGVDVWRYAG
jgi:virginiamycin B lyase